MAIAMRARMADLTRQWRASGIEEPMQCRMGISTAFCTVGNFGSEHRLDYTIVGAGVNLAARLEQAAEPGEILISYETYAQVNDRIRCEERDRIAVKGFAEPVASYRVIGPIGREAETDAAPVQAALPNLTLELDPAAMTEEERARARELVQAAVQEQGWSAGEGPIHRALGGQVSLRLTRELLAELKRAHRRRHREVLERERQSIRVHAKDALWAQDATHVGRDDRGQSVQAEVIREVASTRTAEISVGPPADADVVIAAVTVHDVAQRIPARRRTRPEREAIPPRGREGRAPPCTVANRVPHRRAPATARQTRRPRRRSPGS